MASNFNFPSPGGVPNANSSTSPLRPFYGSPLDSPLQSYYQDASQLEHDLAASHDVTTQAAAKELLNYGLIKYLTLAIAAPFEAGQTLLQVQYMPNNTSDPSINNEDLAEQERRDEEFRRMQEEMDEEEYLNDGSGSGGYYSSSTRHDHFPSPRSNVNKLDPSSVVFRERRDFDQSGYLIRTNVYDDSSRPAFQLPPQEEGVWQVVKALAYHPTEGYLSLWKGQYTNWVYEILHLFAQPTLEATLNDTFDLYDDTIPLVHLDRVGPNIATMVTSHLVVGFILSPLELVRTRLVVQTSDPKQRKYTGMLNCISTIVSEEGFIALWGGVNLFPTILYHTITPLLSNSIPLIIDRIFGISAADSPVLYAVAELGLDTLDLLIRLPIETIRKRLQIQIQAKIPGKRYETVVETRKRPYAGIMDCVYRIIQEEGGQRRGRSKKQVDEDGGEKDVKTPWYGTWAIRGLYTGLGMHLTSNLAIFAVGAVTNLQDDSDDW
ncbi:mitochondrial carrier domain-containing protein [Gamsiella multidivaricata]|uniref:mitochondrial carrier domain-containing protein n=1 Tax=Gamsiella multidivaricata TaxID=101098 RepID=UPI00222068EF|nr:mitochondrial carrier domain-containing protein [Gamsiella multidivaricata]KAG0365174.1 hypothetical protein BGZ54_006788 [Gamsiella multidivaricata]KAI7832705.1 mitochondrial carrier domain-containing protein [Gamsiella multidivaricata]